MYRNKIAEKNLLKTTFLVIYITENTTGKWKFRRKKKWYSSSVVQQSYVYVFFNVWGGEGKEANYKFAAMFDLAE